MGFYEVLFEELEQIDITPVRRLHGHNFLVDEIQYGGRAYNGFMGFEFGPDGKPVELYDLLADPGESVNLAESEPKQRDSLLKQLQAWREARNAPMPSPLNG